MALLALLGAGGEIGQSRDKLIALLWPERSDRAARHLLADSVYRLRKVLGEATVITDGDTLRLNRAVVRPDIQDFQAALSAEDLETAVHLYRGPFLDGFHLPDTSGEFERWVDADRSRLRLEVERAAEVLAERAEAGGDLLRAVGWWRRLMELDPINSRVAGRLMHALAGTGDRANAIQFGRDHERLLREELGIEFPAELRALLERLKEPPEPRGPPGLSPADPVAASLSFGVPFRDPPFGGRRIRTSVDPMPFGFVSRDEELRKLRGFLDDALAGRGRIGFITGESGTGKTALAEEFCRRAADARSDLVVATGNANAHTGAGDPYHPFRHVLGLLTGDVEARWAAGSLSRAHATRLWNILPVTASAIAGVGRDLLGTLVPTRDLLERITAFEAGRRSDQASLTEVFRSLGEAPQALSTQAALFNQCLRVLQAVARTRPLLLVLEDLQWADQGSADMLFQLGRELHGSRILILGLYRPSEVALGRNGGRHPLEPVVHELVRKYGDIEVPLPEEEDGAFVDAVVDALPNRLDRGFREELYRHTRGHALFTVELLMGLQEQGTLTLDAEGRWTCAAVLDQSGLPPRVEAVIAERIGRLPRELERALSVASVEGERFTLEAVAELSGFSVDDLLFRVAGELERRHHLVRAQGFRQTREQTLSDYRFRHGLFQRFLYERLDPVERAHLHGQMGRALERLHADRAHEIALPLARHFEEAGLTTRAVTHLCEAGEQAKSASAFPEAVAHFRRAVELLHTSPESPERDRMELSAQMALGSIWHGVQGHGLLEAERALERAKELSAQLEERTSRFWIMVGFDAIAHYRARHDAGQGLLGECLTIAEAEGDAGLLAVSHVLLGLNASNRGRHTDALAQYDRFRALYDPVRHLALLSGWVGDPEPYVEGETGLLLWILGHPEKAQERVEGAVRWAHEVGLALTLHFGFLQDVVLRLWLRDTTALLRRTEALRALGIEHGMPQISTWAAFHEGWGLSHGDTPERGVTLMEESLRELDAQEWAVWRPFTAALLGDAYRRTGHADRGLELVERGLETVQETGERIHEPEQHRIHGDLLLALRRPDAAEAALRRALEVAREQEARSYELRAGTSLARLLKETGRAEEAWGTLSGTYDWFTEGFDTSDLREARTLLEELDPRSNRS